MQIICWLRGLFDTFVSPQFWNGGFQISGHLIQDIEEYDNVKVIVGRCKYCGKIDISWTKN